MFTHALYIYDNIFIYICTQANTNKQRRKQASKQAKQNQHPHKHANKHKQTNTQTNKQTHKHTNKHTNKQTRWVAYPQLASIAFLSLALIFANWPSKSGHTGKYVSLEEGQLDQDTYDIMTWGISTISRIMPARL